MIITKDSHLDHGLSAAHIAFILQTFGDVKEFKIATIDLPADLPSVMCALRGPLVGDAPISESEVCYVKRGNRAGESRMTSRYDMKRVRQLSVIIGADAQGQTILYTAFGGPVAPREPFDTSLDAEGKAASEAFWKEHALAIE